ncbi:MAG: helix-turn-helix domain-containing protein [Myxococcota bacterium]
MAVSAATEARRIRALDLRLAGATYRQIGRELGVSHTQAQKDVKAMVREYATEPATEVRHQELARLDRLMMGQWRQAMAGDSESVRNVLAIMDRRAKLLGLDKRVDVAGLIWERARAEGYDPNEALEVARDFLDAME